MTIPCLFAMWRCKKQANGHGDLDAVAGAFQFTRLEIPSEDADLIAVLVGHQQKPAGRV